MAYNTIYTVLNVVTTVLNAQMRRIDLFCKLFGPLVISLIDGISTTIAIWATLGLNVASVVVEYFAIAEVCPMIYPLNTCLMAALGLQEGTSSTSVSPPPSRYSRVQLSSPATTVNTPDLLTSIHPQRTLILYPTLRLHPIHRLIPSLLHRPLIFRSNGCLSSLRRVYLNPHWPRSDFFRRLRNVRYMAGASSYGQNRANACGAVVHQLAGGVHSSGGKLLLGGRATFPCRIRIGGGRYCKPDWAVGVRLVCTDYHPRGMQSSTPSLANAALTNNRQ